MTRIANDPIKTIMKFIELGIAFHRRGLEDGLELALCELDKAENLEECKEAISEMLRMVKEGKFVRLREMLKTG